MHEWIKNSHLRGRLKGESKKVVDDRSCVSKSQFEVCQPGVFDELKMRFYENYE